MRVTQWLIYAALMGCTAEEEDYLAVDWELGETVRPGDLVASQDPGTCDKWDSSACAADGFCNDGQCEDVQERTYRITVVGAEVGARRPDGSEWESNPFNFTGPDLFAVVRWSNLDLDAVGDDSCSTPEVSDTYTPVWNTRCRVSPVPVVEDALGGFLGEQVAVEPEVSVSLYEVDDALFFEYSNYIYSFSWRGAELDQLTRWAGNNKTQVVNDGGSVSITLTLELL